MLIYSFVENLHSQAPIFFLNIFFSTRVSKLNIQTLFQTTQILFWMCYQGLDAWDTQLKKGKVSNLNFELKTRNNDTKCFLDLFKLSRFNLKLSIIPQDLLPFY